MRMIGGQCDKCVCEAPAVRALPLHRAPISKRYIFNSI